jgi:hypothetical protein
VRITITCTNELKIKATARGVKPSPSASSQAASGQRSVSSRDQRLAGQAARARSASLVAVHPGSRPAARRAVVSRGAFCRVGARASARRWRATKGLVEPQGPAVARRLMPMSIQTILIELTAARPGCRVPATALTPPPRRYRRPCRVLRPAAALPHLEAELPTAVVSARSQGGDQLIRRQLISKRPAKRPRHVNRGLCAYRCLLLTPGS